MNLTINKNKFKVKTVMSSKDTSEGMMNKKFDNTFNGMLFIMSEGQHCFWMKNCITNLDIIFIEDDVITNRELRIYKEVLKKEKQENRYDTITQHEDYSYHWSEFIDRDTLVTHVKKCCYHKKIIQHVDTMCKETIVSHVKTCCKHERNE